MRSCLEIFLVFFVLASGSNCLDIDGESLEWKSLKSEIRDRFPSVVQLSTDELAHWLAEEDVQTPLVLDARTPEEYAVSHLPNAILASSEEEVLENLKAIDEGRAVVIYCAVGYRSSQLAERLGELGYKNVYNLEGSIFQWANEGRSVYRGREEVHVVHPYDDRWGQLLSPELWSYEP